MQDNNEKINRREAIKVGGLCLTGLATTPGIVNAGGDDFRETIERSHQVKRGTGSVEKWLAYLETFDIYGVTVHHSFTFQKGAGTEKVDDQSDLDINISLVYDCDTEKYYSELTWYYDDGPGEDPRDIVALFYDESWWKLAYDSISDSTSTSQWVRPEEEWGFDFEGPGYSMDDEDATWFHDWDDKHWAGVYLEPRDDNVDSEDREIQGEYTHTWKNISIESVSVSYPSGISATFSDETYTWSTKTEQDGDTLLRLSQDDATLENCGGIQ